LKPKFGNRVKLLYMDTDSFILEIESDDLNTELYDLKEHFDFSNYPIGHPLYDITNKKVLGKFKNEFGGGSPLEFHGIRAKNYNIYSVQDSTDEKKYIKKCKGTVKSVVKALMRKDFHDALFKGVIQYRDNIRISSRNFCCSTVVTKDRKAQSPYEDKRYYLDNINSLPYGHYSLLSK